MSYEKFPNQTGQNWPVSPQYQTHPSSTQNANFPQAPQYGTFPDGVSPQTILGSSLKLWLDSDLGITLNGSNVSAWADQSGNGNHVTQGTAGSQPAYTTNAVNGHAELNFDGADDRLSGPAISAVLSAAAWTVWIVALTDAIGTNSATPYLNDGLMSDAGQFWGLHLRNDTPTARIYNFDGTADSDSTTYAIGAYSILRARQNGTTIFVKNGAAAESAGVASGALTNLTNALVIGGPTAGVSFDGKIANVIATNAVTSAAQHTAIDAYLALRYGL